MTEYVRRGTNKDPDAKAPPAKEIHALKAPSAAEIAGEEYSMAQ